MSFRRARASRAAPPPGTFSTPVGGRTVQGDAADMALIQATSGSYDLIAPTASSRGRLDRLLFGSVTGRLLGQSPVPVLTLRA